MTPDWLDIVLPLIAGIAATVGAVAGWAIRSRRAARESAALQEALRALRADPQPAMVAFLNAGAEMLNVQANALHDEIACLELEVARKRKRLAELTKDGREGETAFLQDALALLHRKLIEYQEVARRLQVHNARTALFRMRIESGALNAALAFRHKVEADTGIAALRATDQAQRRELMADPRNRRSEKAPIALAEWRARSASARRQATRLKPRLGK